MQTENCDFIINEVVVKDEKMRTISLRVSARAN